MSLRLVLLLFHNVSRRRDIDPTTARPAEAETIEESSKFGHCILVRTQQNHTMQMGLTTQEELQRADNSFFTKIIRAERTTIQDGRMNDGSNDPAEQNEEPPD